MLSSNVGVSKSDVAAKVPPAKGRGFRSSVKLGSKKLYRRVGHHRRKTDGKCKAAKYRLLKNPFLVRFG